jgi:DNA polymerase IV
MKVIHVDCDCFFAAVEMRDNPSLRDVPIAIGGASDRRGVIATCNYPARRYGVRSAMPTSHALRLCPELRLVPGDMAHYKAVSRDIMAILQSYVTSSETGFEQVSIDEAYLALPDSVNATELASELKQAVFAATGITVSAGVAPNKFLAKIASDWRKPDGLFVIKPHQVQSFVQVLPVGKIPGVGPRSVERLAALNIHTCADALAHGRDNLIRRFGQFGAHVYERACGVDKRPVAQREGRKSLSVERTFATDIHAEQEINSALQDLWERLQKRLHCGQYAHLTLQPFVKVKFADFRVTTLAQADAQAQPEVYLELIKQAMQRQPSPVRLLGIGGRLPELNTGQLNLF